MRAITKTGQPEALIRWKAENAASPQNLSYGGSFPSEAVRRSLLAEQLHLCAYTLRQLKTAAACEADGQDTTASCHIEHVVPQCSEISGKDIEYQNLVASYPPSQSKVACEFGAKQKDDFDPISGKYIDRKRMTKEKVDIEALAQVGRFVSPLSHAVSHHFEFDASGSVKGPTADGQTTIKVLRLDHKTLANDRESVINGCLKPKGKWVSAQAARRLAREVMTPDAERRLPAYCVAVAQVALAHAEREERRAARLQKKGVR